MCLLVSRRIVLDVASMSATKLSEIASSTPDENRLLSRKTLLNLRASSRILSSRSDDELRMMLYSEKEYNRVDRDFIKAIENFDSKNCVWMYVWVIPDVRYFNVGKISRNRFCNVECESSTQTVKPYSISQSFSSTLELSKSTVK